MVTVPNIIKWPGASCLLGKCAELRFDRLERDDRPNDQLRETFATRHIVARNNLVFGQFAVADNHGVILKTERSLRVRSLDISYWVWMLGELSVVWRRCSGDNELDVAVGVRAEIAVRLATSADERA
jgi:hypothetical protein